MRIVHAIADCRNCDWHCGDYRNAQINAREHSRTTGHTVALEVGYAQQYVAGKAQFRS